MELERHGIGRGATAHIVVRGGLGSDVGDLPSGVIESVDGDTRVTVQPADPAQLYDILDQLRDSKPTLLSLAQTSSKLNGQAGKLSRPG